MSRKYNQTRSSHARVRFLIFLFISLSCISRLYAGLDPYTITRTTGNTYSDISGGTAVTSWSRVDTIPSPIPFLPPTISINDDDNLSKNLLPIGFTFYYDGSPQTQFRVGTNGFLTFNTATNASGDILPACGDADAYSGDNATFSIPKTKGSISVIAPFYDDLETNGTYAMNATVHYQTSGTAPNRILTVQWRGMSVGVNSNCTSPCSYGNYNFQIKLYEATGDIEFVYGTMTAGADEYSKSYLSGLNSASMPLTPSSTSHSLVQQTANTATFNYPVINNLSQLPAANSKITFTRTAPSPATGVPTCIYYNFPAHNATNQCRNSIISWSACDGVPTTFDVYFGTTNPPPLSTSPNGSNRVGNFFNPGTLAANTTYYWKVVPENSFGSATINTVYSFTTGAANSVTGITITPTPQVSNTICVGQPVTLTVNGSLAEGSVYNWTSPFLLDLGCKNNPPIGLGLFGDCEGNSVSITPLNSGTLTYDVFARGCNGTSSCVRTTINVIDAATAPTNIQSSAGTNVCVGTGTTLTAQGGTGSQYEWFSGSCGGTPIGNTVSIGVVMTGGSTTYYVRRIDPCTNTPTPTCASITLNEFTIDVGNNNIGVNQTICAGEIPLTLNGSLPTPQDGTVFVYAWESSTLSDSTGFAPASGTNNQLNYSFPGALSTTTWYRRIVIAKNNAGLNCSDANVSNVAVITVPNGQCDDGNVCTNDFCLNGTCSHQCTLQIDSLIYLSNTIHGCNDGSISATIFQGCEWTTTLYAGNNVVRTWSYTQGADIFWDNITPNNYQMVASEPGGCKDSTINFIVNTGLPCSINILNTASTPTSVEGCDDGSINAIVNAFVCEGAWSALLLDEFDEIVGNWNFNSGTALLWENLPAGNYSILVDDGGNCTKEVNVSVPSGDPCRVQIQNVQKTVANCNTNTITADLSVLTCTNQWYAYLYVSDYSSFVKQWDHSLGTLITWDSLPLGDYHLFATNFESCSDTFDISLSCSTTTPAPLTNVPEDARIRSSAMTTISARKISASRTDSAPTRPSSAMTVTHALQMPA